jgi:uncharacterized protein YceK
MKHRLIPCLLCLTLLLSGCSSLITRFGEDEQLGHPYSGLTANRAYWSCFIEGREEMSRAAFYSLMPIGGLILLTDSLMTVVLDTLFFPWDYFYKAKKPLLTKQEIAANYCGPVRSAQFIELKQKKPVVVKLD